MKAYAMALALGTGVTVAGLFYAATVQRGVTKERVRVEAQGKKIDATVAKKQRAVAAEPPNRVLDRWSVK